MYSPTTRAALFFPSSLVELTPLIMDAAAIFVMLIELVFVARIASGRSSVANAWKIVCLRTRFSETACPKRLLYQYSRLVNRLNAYLDDHIDISEAVDSSYYRDPPFGILGFVIRQPSFGNILREELVHQRETLRNLFRRPIV